MSREDLSVSVVELNLERVKWDTAEAFTREASNLYKRGRIPEAYKFCKKALGADPHFYPAKDLLRTIEKGNEQGISEIEPPEFYDSGREGGAYGGTSQRPRQVHFNAGEVLEDTMQYEQVQNDRGRHAYHDLNGQGSSTVGAMREGILRHQMNEEEPPQRRTNRANGEYVSKLDRSGRRESYLREVLLEGHFASRQPLEVFHELRKILWCEEKGKFICPVQNCHFTFKKRVEACTHFLDDHLQTDDNGVEVRPFFCKTCREKFRDVNLLIRHGESVHPACKWLKPLKMGVEDRM